MASAPPPPSPRSAGSAFHERRLHPATIIIDVLRRLSRLAYILIIIVVLSFMGGDSKRETRYEIIAGAIAAFGVVSAVLRYVSMRYGFEDDRLVIRSGILNRQKRTIPVDRIQNLQIQRGVLHRMFNVVDLRIETAVAGGAEAVLSSVSVPQADELRREIAKRRGSEEAENADVPAEADNVIWRASAADLFILGSTANRAGVIIGAISGLYFSFQEVIEKNYDTFIRQFPALAHLDRSSAPMIAIALLGLIFIGWLVSILSTFLTYYGFVLRKRDDRLLRQYGLLTNVESVLKQNRIQSLRISSPLLRRLLHRATLYAESAGSFGDKAASGQSPLCPLTTVPRLTELCAVAIPALHYATLQWHPVDRKTIRRGFVRYAFLPCLVLIALGLFYNKLWWIGVPVWLVISVGLAYARYRAMGYVDDPAFVASRYGILTREIRVLPRAKIQHVKLEANPFQRRQGLATLHIATAGANSDVPIIDLPRDDAEALLERLSTDASAAGEWLPDGV